ncbi:hypothetical protein [Lentzea atacamensis]|uniref:hypothetical protein n=1 Tax=Lentzea atacamensis TaxID=531938 RepID=UPI0011BF8902|nr:hypothetical protein [Lentzea atacamensis]
MSVSRKVTVGALAAVALAGGLTASPSMALSGGTVVPDGAYKFLAKRRLADRRLAAQGDRQVAGRAADGLSPEQLHRRHQSADGRRQCQTHRGCPPG